MSFPYTHAIDAIRALDLPGPYDSGSQYYFAVQIEPRDMTVAAANPPKQT
jgi:hypothetical protein